MSDKVENQVPNFENMSDEEFMNVDWDLFDTQEAPEEVPSQEGTPTEGEVEEPQEESYEGEPEGIEQEGEPEESEQEVQTSGLVGKPIKIGNQEYTFNSEEEIVQLINQSVQSQSQLSEFSKYQATLGMLEKNEMLDEGKLSFAMDLLEGKTEAIRKLIADKQISMDDIDTDTEVDYKPSDRSVSEKELEWKGLSQQLQSTDEGRKAIDIVANQWDANSRKALMEQPSNLLHLANQIKDGSYDRIINEVSRRRLLGQIGSNVGLLQAYAQVGKELLGGEKTEPTVESKPKRSVPDTRKRATSTRQTVHQPKQEPSLEEMANMSDEDFLKLF